MKVFISKYRNHWISPYTIIDYVFFWTDWSRCHRNFRSNYLNDDSKFVDRPDWVEVWSDRLIPISQGIQRILDIIHPKINYVKIDRWDTWNMDNTLSIIILPMLKQLKATTHGAPLVADEDVPEELRSTSAAPKENEWDTDSNHFKRWDWILDEMIFAFEHTVDESWQDEYSSGEIDFISVPVDEDGNEVAKGEHKFYRLDRTEKDTYKCDFEGMKLVENRIKNGFALFGKYYSSLWD